METTSLNSLFTSQSLLSLQGASAATLLVTNVAGYLIGPVFDVFKKWTSVVVALGLAYLVAHLAETQLWYKWIVAFFNGLLIFSSAAGINQMSSRPPTVELDPGAAAGASVGIPGIVVRKRFFTSWF
jgi:hypothetical protein